MTKFLLLLIGTSISYTISAQTPPTATTSPAEPLFNEALLKGVVNPNGSSTSVRFQYGYTTNYTVNTYPQTISGSSNINVQEQLYSLLANKEYHYRIVAQNAGGITYGNDVVFYTMTRNPVPPTISVPVNNMYASQPHYALSVRINADNNDPDTKNVIQETTTGKYVSTSGTLVDNPVELFKFTEYAVSGLTPGTTYTFRAGVRKVSNPNDIVYGPTASRATTSATFYPKKLSVDLSVLNNWTTEPTGDCCGSAPVNFTYPNQLFIVNNNIGIGSVPHPWTISGGSSVRLDQSMAIEPAGRITVGTGSTFNFNNKTVFINSNSTGTGSIGTISGTITGAINVWAERFIPAKRAWRMLNTPILTTGSIHTAWQEGATTASPNPNPILGYGTHITGGSVADGFDQGPTNNYSIKTYDNATDSWVPVPNTNATPVSSNVFMLFVRGDRSVDLSAGTAAPPTNTTLRVFGSLRTGNQTYGVSATGFTPIPNPYPSAIDFATFTKNNVQDNFFVWDPKMAGTFGVGAFVNVSFNGTGYDVTPPPVSPISQVIQSHQSFLVRSTGTAGSVVIKETDKMAGSANVFRNGNTAQHVKINLMSTEANNTSSILDGVLASFDQGYSNTTDNMDVVKLSNFNENIGMVKNNETFIVERRSTIVSSDTIHLKLWNVTEKNYKLQFVPINITAGSLSAFLVDEYQNTTTPISLSDTSVVDYIVNSNPASAAPGRFRVVFLANNPLPVLLTSLKAFHQNGAVHVAWDVVSESNVAAYEVEKSADGTMFNRTVSMAAKANNSSSVTYSWVDLSSFPGNNYYRIKIILANGDIKYSQVVKVKAPGSKGEITVYPNPMRGKTINVQLASKPADVYTVELYNSMGQMIFQGQVRHLGGSSTQSLDVGTKPAKGAYQVIIRNGQTKKTFSIMID